MKLDEYLDSNLELVPSSWAQIMAKDPAVCCVLIVPKGLYADLYAQVSKDNGVYHAFKDEEKEINKLSDDEVFIVVTEAPDNLTVTIPTDEDYDKPLTIHTIVKDYLDKYGYHDIEYCNRIDWKAYKKYAGIS